MEERGSETLTAVSRVSMGTKPPAPSQCGDRTLPKNYQIQTSAGEVFGSPTNTDGRYGAAAMSSVRSVGDADQNWPRRNIPTPAGPQELKIKRRKGEKRRARERAKERSDTRRKKKGRSCPAIMRILCLPSYCFAPPV